jgi:hypothetical protein
MGRISVYGYERYEDEGTPENAMHTTSFHVCKEVGHISSLLELERASCRGVRIPPHAVGSLIVMAPDAPLLSILRHWLKERRRALAARAKWQAWLRASA